MNFAGYARETGRSMGRLLEDFTSVIFTINKKSRYHGAFLLKVYRHTKE